MTTDTKIKPAATKGIKGLGKLSDIANRAVKKDVPAPDAEIDISLLYALRQVRRKFSGLEDLSESIKLNGIIEPLVVHEEADGRYRIIVGERRFRAAPLAGLTKVPVVIKRDLSELEIRRMQVAENNDRENLTAMDQALGVIEDVETYGMEEARRIWNKPDPKNPGKEMVSEGWISKRLAIANYLPQTRALLEGGISSDFEVLHCMNQLEGIAADNHWFQTFKGMLEKGEPVGRDFIRQRVTSEKDHQREAEEWRKQQEAKRKQEEADAAARPAQSPAPAVPTDAKHDTADASAPDDVTPATKVRMDKQDERPTKPEKKQPAAPLVPSPEQLAAAKRERAQIALDDCRGCIFDIGQHSADLIGDVVEHGAVLELPPAEIDWLHWTAFVATVLPTLQALGPDKTKLFMGRLQQDLKGTSPNELLDKHFPGDESDRDVLPEMPKGWRP